MSVKMPCEIVGWYLLPAIRKGVVNAMVAEGKVPRKKVAKALGITEAAVCNYMKGKRGANLPLGSEWNMEIRKIAKKMANAGKGGEKEFIIDTCALCTRVRKAGLLCKMHREHGAPKGCSSC
ncbi:MAG: hypothetical protein V1676_04685 [Candidatus Diapherotrites archaeon]